MIIDVIRNVFTNDSTIGEMYIDGKFFCYTLEDKDRALYQSQSVDEIKKVKVQDNTAIPYGKYFITLSPTTLKGVGELDGKLLSIEDVKGFASIKIHSGNTKEHTRGCILVGETKSKNFIGNSKKTVAKLMTTCYKAFEKDELITLNIKQQNGK